MASSTYFNNLALNYVFCGVDGGVPSTLYVALLTSDPTVTGLTGEVIGSDYMRQVVTFSTTTTGVISNSSAISFGTTQTDWGELTHYAIVTAAGDPLVFGELNVTQAPVGTPVVIPANALTIGLE